MRLPVHIWIREENAVPREIAGYFTELARRLDGHPRKMRLTVESSVPVTLDFEPDSGNPVVTAAGSSFRFDIRRRWLPEHPVPLEFGKKPIVLLVDPTDGNRFRVRSGRRIPVPRWTYPLLAVCGIASAVSLHPAVIAVSSVAAFAVFVPAASSAYRRFRRR